MWLKEEFIGLEETFKLTNPILDCFCRAVIEGRDASIEQYLLNFWTKSLSLRDSLDRIQISSRQSQENSEEVFSSLHQQERHYFDRQDLDKTINSHVGQIIITNKAPLHPRTTSQPQLDEPPEQPPASTSAAN